MRGLAPISARPAEIGTKETSRIVDDVAILEKVKKREP